jgi:hypothetical protein
VDSKGLDSEEWVFRYHLEEQLLAVYRVEEKYWRQRGGIKWTLQGDANTAYFHVVANERRIQCNIFVLRSEADPIIGKRQIQEHVYDFYHQLLETEAIRVCGVAPESSGDEARVSEAENSDLLHTFFKQELENIVMDMKSDTVPSTDGFPVIFFKRCWPLVKHGVLDILNDFILVRNDITWIMILEKYEISSASTA